MLYLHLLKQPLTRLSLFLSCFPAIPVHGAPSSTSSNLATQFKNTFESTLNNQPPEGPLNLTRREINSLNKPSSFKFESLPLRRDDETWSQFVKDLGDASTHNRRDSVDPHIAHLPLPKPDGSTFDLQIPKDSMCDATKFTIAIIPNPDPKQGWQPVNGKTYGEVAKAIHGASEPDIGKASKRLVDTVLAMAKPAFGHLSGGSSCKPVFPAPRKRDASGSSLGNTNNSIDKIIDAARFWILREVDFGSLVYLGSLIGFRFHALQVAQAGGNVFAGGADQGNPAMTANRATAHAYIIIMLMYVIVEELSKAIKWGSINEAVTTKVIHPLVNVLFDRMQEIWDQIKPNQAKNRQGKRGDAAAASYCLNVNDFKFLVENISVISDNDIKDLEAKDSGGCPKPKI